MARTMAALRDRVHALMPQARSDLAELEDTPDGHPAVYGHIPAPAGAPTVLLYCHHAMEGQGGSIPLCNALHATYPDAEIMMIGVEEPRCLIHAPNESVDPAELERIALAEAVFLRSYS
jgi:acetylornithine deacetylase/succinyl-diaminopimelate desuccinylase-like protein